ncbi:sigma-70 family RNA polymerase sigma factor [Bowmanella sp. Y26]|nr:sigma-70 family RNA polymerase sigma factor [Bowmanella yangjiangensis]
MSEFLQKKHAISTAFVAMRSSLERVVGRFVPAREIEDVVQDTYVRILQSEQLDCIKRPESYLYKTAVNLAKDYLKSAQHNLSFHVEDIDLIEHSQSGEDVVFKQFASEQEFSRFCDAVGELPEQCRRVFVLRKVYGFSQKEIAKSMNLSVSTVEKHIALGLKRSYLSLRKSAKPVAEPVANGTDKVVGGL